MGEVDQQLKKFVRLVIAGVQDNQIAEVFDITPGRVSQIKDTPEYKTMYLKEMDGSIEKNNTFNDTWDEVETEALKTVRRTLEHNSDPEFALKAAMLANRANRRGSLGNKPLPAQMGERLAINLNTHFVQVLQQTYVAAKDDMGGVTEIKPGSGAVKHTNLLEPHNVSSMFVGKKEKDLFNEAELAQVAIDA